MKAAALIVQCTNGQIHSVGATSLVGLRDLAKTVRNSARIDIGGTAVAVAEGVVLASWQMAPVMKFRCAKAGEVRAEASEPVSEPVAKRRPRK